MSLIASSNTPCVLGYVTISAARLAECSAAFALRSATSMLPFASVFTTTTCMPAITALAGLVPCADCGIRQTVRCVSPRDSWYARITSSPVYSPCEPAFGCSETAGNPVISASAASSAAEHRRVSLCLFARRERMDAAELGPRHREHLRRRVELHRAAAERDHRVRERQVARLERAHVAQHLGFRMVRAEHRMRAERARAREALVVAVVHVLRERVVIERGRRPAVEHRQQVVDVGDRRESRRARRRCRRPRSSAG